MNQTDSIPGKRTATKRLPSSTAMVVFGLLFIVFGSLPVPPIAHGIGGGNQLYGSESSASVKKTDTQKSKVDRAIERGLDFLASQQEESGAFGAQYPVAVTALAGMGFLGAGVEYNRGKHGGVIYDAVRYLRSRTDVDSGYIRDEGNSPSRMHGHAYAVLFLAQVVGTIDNEDLARKLRRDLSKSIQFIETNQTSDGGWGYEPHDRFDEASITVCCLQALRAARDAGFLVDAMRIRAAMGYLKRCSKSDGSFMYSLARKQSKSTFELTAAAVSTLHAAGEYASKEHDEGIKFLRRRLARYRSRPLDASIDYRYYGNLYAAQVFHQLGGEDWSKWSEEALSDLVSEQATEGSWSSRFGKEYATAVSLLILEVPLGYLPIFER